MEQLIRNFLAASDKKFEGGKSKNISDLLAFPMSRMVALTLAKVQYNNLRDVLQPVQVKNMQTGKTSWGRSDAFNNLRKLHNVRFRVKHRGASHVEEYKIKRFAFDAELGAEGDCAKTHTFEKTMPDGTKKKYSIQQYYAEQYNARLQYPHWPLIETNKAGLFPIEVCEVARFSQYGSKLDPEQVGDPVTRFSTDTALTSHRPKP
jgi:eukaryotic translation initiation factor 2C